MIYTLVHLDRFSKTRYSYRRADHFSRIFRRMFFHSSQTILLLIRLLRISDQFMNRVNRPILHAPCCDLQVGQNFLSLRREIKEEIEKILVGQYIYEDNQDWIISGKRKINLAKCFFRSTRSFTFTCGVIGPRQYYRSGVVIINFLHRRAGSASFPGISKAAHRFILTALQICWDETFYSQRIALIY